MSSQTPFGKPISHVRCSLSHSFNGRTSSLVLFMTALNVHCTLLTSGRVNWNIKAVRYIPFTIFRNPDWLQPMNRGKTINSPNQFHMFLCLKTFMILRLSSSIYNKTCSRHLHYLPLTMLHVSSYIQVYIGLTYAYHCFQ